MSDPALHPRKPCAIRASFLAIVSGGLLCLPASSWAQANPCDISQDGTVNFTDVGLAVNMALDLTPCTTGIQGAGVCTAVAVQRVVNAALGNACVSTVAANGHVVTLKWAPSQAAGVVGYNVYRANSPFGPFSKLNLALIGQTSYADATVQPGQSYYYVATAVDAAGNESIFSSPPVQITIPNP